MIDLKKIAFAIVLIGLLLGVGWFLSSDKNNDETLGNNNRQAMPSADIDQPFPASSASAGPSELQSASVAKESENLEELYRPAQLYSDYLKKAESGDVDSAYVLTTALNDCRGVAQSDSEFEATYANSVFSDDLVQAARHRYLRCRPLLERVADIPREHERWYRVVKEAQHPLFLVKQRNHSYEETRSLVLAALSQQYPESHVYYQAYLAAARLYKEYPAAGIDETRFLSWQLMACGASNNCDREKMAIDLSEQLPRNQFDEVFELEATLREAMQQGELTRLGI